MSDNSVPKILHVHSTFAPGGKELRAVQLMNAFGDAAEHTVVSSMPQQMGARDHIAEGVKVEFPSDFPALTGLPTPGRLVEVAKAMRGFDLVLSYNWGAMNAVMAHTVFADPLNLPPLIHHEDGFNEDEADKLSTKRNWFRRVALRRSHKLVVPSRVLESIATETWQTRRAKLQRIPNGIDTKKFAGKPDPSSIRLVKRKGERWIGTFAGLRAVKQLPMLVEACERLPEDWQLVIFGEGPERDAIQAKADQLEMSHRVHLPGAVTNPHQLVGMLDIFALSSRSEQFPLSVVEAMAAGLPIAAPEVGDMRTILSEANRAYLAAQNDCKSLTQIIEMLVKGEDLRAELGEENQKKAQAQFDEAQMIETYRKLYWGAMDRHA